LLLQDPRFGGSRSLSSLLGAICIAMRLKAQLADMDPVAISLAVALLGELKTNLLALPGGDEVEAVNIL